MTKVNNMTPFELKRWGGLIDAVNLINKTATSKGFDLNDPKTCQDYMKPKDILNYMEDVSSKMR